MACLTGYTIKGIKLDCNANLAGIKRVWLAYDGDFKALVDETTHKATSFKSASTASDAKLYQYDFTKQSGSLTSTLTKDEASGTRYYTNELVLSFNKMEGAKHIEIEAMAAESLFGIVEDNNGKCWILGTVYNGTDTESTEEGGYLSASASTAQAGQSYGDKNGYDVTLQQMSSHLPYEIDKADFASFVA